MFQTGTFKNQRDIIQVPRVNYADTDQHNYWVIHTELTFVFGPTWYKFVSVVNQSGKISKCSQLIEDSLCDTLYWTPKRMFQPQKRQQKIIALRHDDWKSHLGICLLKWNHMCCKNPGQRKKKALEWLFEARRFLRNLTVSEDSDPDQICGQANSTDLFFLFAFIG